MSAQEVSCAVAALQEKFRLEQSFGNIFLPLNAGILIARTMQEAIKLAERDRSALMRLAPRQFEEFLEEIFTRLGFKVELTKATRDGGADLLCLKSEHGIPFRLAVEAKRYKEDRPIDVSLVRSFVGANEQFKANRLLYVTTSYYTRPAQDYADKFASHILTLKDYDQIREWCQEYMRITPRLL